MAKTGIQAMSVECECPPEHTITKLGHCATCPAYRPRYAAASARPDSGAVTFFVCPPGHPDDTPHDFDWATYSDELMSCGVCRCGIRQIDYDRMVMP